MKLSSKSGATLAAVAAALIIGGGALAPAPVLAATAKVKCLGGNTCKGHSDCKTANNVCKGHNSCKGKGFKMLSASRCLAKGGTVAS